jgi:hypothetical protein
MKSLEKRGILLCLSNSKLNLLPTSVLYKILQALMACKLQQVNNGCLVAKNNNNSLLIYL